MSIIDIPENERKAATKLAQALYDAMKSLPDDEIAPAMNAFYKSKQDNCWFMLYLLRDIMPGMLAIEAQERGVDTKPYFHTKLLEQK